MQGPLSTLTIKSGTPFQTAMQQIHQAKPNVVTIEGRDYRLQWLKSSVEVSRLNCSFEIGVTENISRYKNIASAVAWDMAPGQLSSVDSGFTEIASPSINSDEHIPLDSLDHFGQRQYGSFRRTTETTTTSESAAFAWDTFQTRSQQIQEAQNKLYADKQKVEQIQEAQNKLRADEQKYGRDFAKFLHNVHVPLELAPYFEKAMQDVDDGLEKFRLWAENLKSENLEPRSAKRVLNYQNSSDLVASDDDEGADVIAAKDTSDPRRDVMTEAHEVYVTLCLGYLKSSVATTHRDLSREYLNNVSRFAKETAEVIISDRGQPTVESDIERFSDWEEKYLPRKKEFIGHDQKSTDAKLDKLGGSERVHLRQQLGDPVANRGVVQPNKNASLVKKVDAAPARPKKVLQNDQLLRTDTATYTENFLSGL